MLAQRPPTLSKWAAAPKGTVRPTRSAHEARIVAKRDGMQFMLSGEDGDLSPALAAGLFVAFKQGVVKATIANMRTVMAGCVVAMVAANMLARRNEHSWDLNTLAPAALATETLGFLELGPAAIAAFGTLLCTACEDVFQIKGGYYALLASLAAAVYYKVGAVWICAAIIVAYGNAFVTNAQDSKIVAAPATITLASLFALVAYAKDQSMTCATEICVAVVVARCLWSLFKGGKSIFDSVAN